MFFFGGGGLGESTSFHRQPLHQGSLLKNNEKNIIKIIIKNKNETKRIKKKKNILSSILLPSFPSRLK